MLVLALNLGHGASRGVGQLGIFIPNVPNCVHHQVGRQDHKQGDC